MPVRPNGQAARPKAYNDSLPLRTFQAWLSMFGAEFMST